MFHGSMFTLSNWVVESRCVLSSGRKPPSLDGKHLLSMELVKITKKDVNLRNNLSQLLESLVSSPLGSDDKDRKMYMLWKLCCCESHSLYLQWMSSILRPVVPSVFKFVFNSSIQISVKKVEINRCIKNWKLGDLLSSHFQKASTWQSYRKLESLERKSRSLTKVLKYFVPLGFELDQP